MGAQQSVIEKRCTLPTHNNSSGVDEKQKTANESRCVWGHQSRHVINIDTYINQTASVSPDAKVGALTMLWGKTKGKHPIKCEYWNGKMESQKNTLSRIGLGEWLLCSTLVKKLKWIDSSSHSHETPLTRTHTLEHSFLKWKRTLTYVNSSPHGVGFSRYAHRCSLQILRIIRFRLDLIEGIGGVIMIRSKNPEQVSSYVITSQDNLHAERWHLVCSRINISPNCWKLWMILSIWMLRT